MHQLRDVMNTNIWLYLVAEYADRKRHTHTHTYTHTHTMTL